MTKNAPTASAKPDHEETHDEWFRRKAQEGLDRADSPDAKWFAHEDVVARSEVRRTEIMARVKKVKTN